MKRVVSIILSVVCIFTMSIFAFADINAPQLKYFVDGGLRAIENDESFQLIPKDYKYRYVFSFASNTGNEINMLAVYYSKTQNISNGDSIYVGEYNYPTNLVRGVVMKTASASYWSTYNYISMVLSIGSGHLGRLYVDRSTATYNQAHNLMKQYFPNKDYRYLLGDPIDLSLLESLIAQAERMEKELYTVDSWANLESVLNDAKAMIVGTPSELEVVGMCDLLNEAIYDLQLKPPPLDLSVLKSLIAQAEQKQESEYTAESWSVLRLALADAKSLVSEITAQQLSIRDMNTLRAVTYTQQQVDAMSSRLQAAINGLQLKPSPPPTIPTTPSNHRYMVDGFLIDDLIPAQNAIMENFNEALKFGIFAFVVIIISFILPRIIRRILNIEYSSWDEENGYQAPGKTFDLGRGRKHHANERKQGTKYDDY